MCQRIGGNGFQRGCKIAIFYIGSTEAKERRSAFVCSLSSWEPVFPTSLVGYEKDEIGKEIKQVPFGKAEWRQHWMMAAFIYTTTTATTLALEQFK